MSTLRDELAKKQMALKPADDASMVVTTSPGETGFIEFHINPHNCCGYAPSQLMHYQLFTHKPDVASDPTKPAQTLTLCFPSADLIITGDRLQHITAALKQGTLDTVRVISPRHAQLNLRLPFVASIEIKRIDQTTGEPLSL